MSISTIETKYIILGYVAKEAIWIKQFIYKLQLDILENLTLFNNNKISINLTKNIKNQYCIKSIDVQYYYIRQLINENELTVK